MFFYLAQAHLLPFTHVKPLVDGTLLTLMGWHGDVTSEGSPSVQRMEEDIVANGYRMHGDVVTMQASQLPVPQGGDALKHQFAENKQRVRERLASHTAWLVTALETRFPDYGLVSCFTVLTPDFYLEIKALAEPTKLDDGSIVLPKLQKHGMTEIKTLVAHYGRSKQLKDGTVVQPMVDETETLVEFSHFKSYLHSIVKDPVQTFLKPDGSVQEFAPWMKQHKDVFKRSFPNLFTLQQIALLVPMTSVAAERGFALMRSIKTKGRSGILDIVLDCLMRIAAVAQNQKLYVQAFYDKYAFKVADRFFLWNRKGGALGRVDDLATYLVSLEEEQEENEA